MEYKGATIDPRLGPIAPPIQSYKTLKQRSSERNCECEKCGKRFGTKSELNMHILRHSGLRNFKCDVCGKLFKSKLDIARHLRTHF